MSPKRNEKEKQKAIHPIRKTFSDWAEAEAKRQAQIVKILPKGVLPLVTSHLPQVSAVPEKGLVSGKPPITIPRYWGILPSRKWGKTKMPITRKIRALRPTEVGLFETLVNVVGAPMTIPTHIVNGMVNLSNKLQVQAEEDLAMSPEDKIKDELLELKMRYEMDEISENDFKIEETKLKRRLRDIQEGEPVKKEEKPKPEKKRKPKEKK